MQHREPMSNRRFAALIIWGILATFMVFVVILSVLNSKG